MDEELDLAPRCQEEPRTMTDQTRQPVCTTDATHQWTPDRTLDDVAGCSFRIKADRRNGTSGMYVGFERRSRRNFSRQHAMPSSLRNGDGL